jgi:aminopeptidase-like protein
LPVGCMMRSQHGQFPEYHTSADNLEFVHPESLADSFGKCRAVIDVLEENRTYINQVPKCEPQLGKRGLYKGLGAGDERRQQELALLWVLNLSDGAHTLLDIAERSELPFDAVVKAAETLCATDLLREATTALRSYRSHQSRKAS